MAGIDDLAVAVKVDRFIGERWVTMRQDFLLVRDGNTVFVDDIRVTVTPHRLTIKDDAALPGTPRTTEADIPIETDQEST